MVARRTTSQKLELILILKGRPGPGPARPSTRRRPEPPARPQRWRQRTPEEAPVKAGGLTFQVIKAQDNICAVTVPPWAPHRPDGGTKSHNLHLQLGRLQTPHMDTALRRKMSPRLTAHLRHPWRQAGQARETETERERQSGCFRSSTPAGPVMLTCFTGSLCVAAPSGHAKQEVNSKSLLQALPSSSSEPAVATSQLFAVWVDTFPGSSPQTGSAFRRGGQSANHSSWRSNAHVHDRRSSVTPGAALLGL